MGACSPKGEGGPTSKLAPGCPGQWPGCPGHSSYHGTQHPADIDWAAAQGRVLHRVVPKLQVAVQQLQADADCLVVKLQETSAAEWDWDGSSISGSSSGTTGRLFPRLVGRNCDATPRRRVSQYLAVVPGNRVDPVLVSMEDEAVLIHHVFLPLGLAFQVDVIFCTVEGEERLVLLLSWLV